MDLQATFAFFTNIFQLTDLMFNLQRDMTQYISFSFANQFLFFGLLFFFASISARNGGALAQFRKTTGLLYGTFLFVLVGLAINSLWIKMHVPLY